MHNNWQKRSQSAQGMVEFALVLPVLLMLILGIFAFGHFFFVYITTVSASREAARYGSAMGPSENGIARFTDCQAIRDSAVRVGSIAGVSTVNIHFDDGANQIESCPVGGGPVANPSNIGLGDRIVVEVTTNYQPIVPLVNIPSFPIRSRSVRTILRNAPVGTAAVAMPANVASKVNTTLTIVSDDPDHSTVGQSVNIVYSLTPSSGSPAPSGNVTISGVNGSNTITCTNTIAAGSCIVALDAPGVWTLTATYSGDENFNPSTDTESHQVYYNTAVSITQNPATSIAGAGTSVIVTYAINPTPSVTGTEKPQFIQISSDGTVICDIPTPDMSGTCTIPAYTAAGTKIITITLPTGDPFFLNSTSSINHVVSIGTAVSTNTVLTVSNNDTSKTIYEVGDLVDFAVSVNRLTGTTPTPNGTFEIKDQSNNVICSNVALDGDGNGQCTSSSGLAWGTNGTWSYTARYIPQSYASFAESYSTPAVTINLVRLSSNVSLLNPTPIVSGVGQTVTINFQVSAVSSSTIPTGRVRVSIIGHAPVCEATLNGTGQGNCSLSLAGMTTGQRSLRLEYLGDSNFQTGNRDYTNALTINNCPIITTARWIDDPPTGQKKDYQMIVRLENPTTNTYQLAEVNTSWPALPVNLSITELQFGQIDEDATDWRCAEHGNTLPPSCLWKKDPGLTTYYATAASGLTCQGAPSGTTCENWMDSSLTSANLSLGPVSGGSDKKDLYFVLNYAVPKTYYEFVYKVRLINQGNAMDESCKWITANYTRP